MAEAGMHPSRVFNLGVFNLMIAAEALVVCCCRERCQPVGLGDKTVVDLVVDQVADVDEVALDVLAGAAKPLVQVDVEDRDAPEHQEKDWQKADRPRTADQLGFDMRTGPVSLALDV